MAKSYFDKNVLKEKIRRLEERKNCPPWLIQALERLGDHAPLLPLEEDKNRFTVEYIYPH